MAIVRDPDSHPHVLQYVYRFVASEPRGVSTAKVITALKAGRQESDGPILKSVAAGVTVGLLEEDDGRVRAGSGLPALLRKAAASSDSDFRRLLRRQVFLKENVSSAVGVAEGEAVRPGSSDFVHALAWISWVPELAHFPDGGGGFEGPITASFAERLGPSPNKWPLPNKEQWTPFLRWALFLGLVWDSGVGIVVNPAGALGEELDRIFDAEDTVLTIEEFVQKTVDVLPYLDDGPLSAGPAGTDEKGKKVLSVPMSIALRSLELQEKVHTRGLKDDRESRAGVVKPISYVEVRSS